MRLEHRITAITSLIPDFLSHIIGEGHGTPLQYSCLENPMDGGAWWAAVHGVTKNRTRLSGFTFTSHFHALEKEMATHSSVLAWRIPGMAEPGGLPSLGSHRVGHDWSNLAAAAVAVYICQCYSLTLSHPLLLLCLQVHFLHLHLYLCPANRFIRTIFLDSIFLHVFLTCIHLLSSFFSFCSLIFKAVSF